MSKFNPFDPANGYSEEDRVALETKCASLINRAYRNPFPGASLRHDGADNAGIFFAKQLAHIKTKAYDKEFPELSGLKLFPQTSDTDEGASYIEYYSYEPVGFAAIIANYASDLPRVDVKGTPHRAEIVNIGDSYGYNVQELRACRRNAVLGIMKSLDAVRAEAARRVYDVKVNHLIWNGDEKAKIVGILSSDNNIPVYTLQNGAGGKADWANKTADEIAADIAGILNYIDTLTQSVEHPDSWVMPNDLYTALNLRRIDGTGESVLSYIKEHTPQIKNWETAGELSKSNKDYNTTGKNIGLLYTKDADKMYHDVPMAFLQHAPQDRNLEIVINCEGRDAGMVIPYPLSACVVARIGTHGFSLVRSMGTQNSRGVVLLAILAKRLEILAVHAVLEPGLVDKDNHVGVFVPITIITAHDYFFNYTFKNMSVKGVQNLILFKCLSEHGDTLAHGSFGFGCILQAFTLFLQLLNLAGQV